ncbi:MAG TPA: type II secretion system protein [Candidatus Paceibacterota bacterium]
MRTHKKFARGITIIETMVSIAIFISAILAVVLTIQYFYKTNTYAVEQAGAVTSADRGVTRLVRAIREAAYSANGAYPVVSLAAHEFTFYADIDGDNRAERMRYFVEENSLKRGVTPPSLDLLNPYAGAEQISTISDNVRNIEQSVNTFSYYDQNGTEITNYSTVTGVRFVSVTIIVNVDPNKLPNQLILHSSAALRNLR